MPNPLKLHRTKIIFMTGGVVSSLGKGLAASAIGALLLARGYRVRLRKLDPYLNLDPGTMNPYQHGECFVTEDGAETDLDLGHYERFTGVFAKKTDNVTAGQIYSQVLQKERRGDYLGGTVQVIPHVTDEIKEFILNDLAEVDILIAEIGGTVGDIESLPFLEAIRQLAQELGREHCAFIHMTLLPYLRTVSELKTKPSQHSVKELLNVGIQADFLLCRSEVEIASEQLKKLALFCNLPASRVFPAMDVDTIYAVPLQYYQYQLDTELLKHFHLPLYRKKSESKKSLLSSAEPHPNIADWQKIVDGIKNPEDTITISIVGKYVMLPDAYKSLIEALIHGGIAEKVKIAIHWADAENITRDNVALVLGQSHGVIVPGGFGVRGVVGKIIAIEYARAQQIPFLGICFGMQLAVLESLRNLGGDKNATSSEFAPANNPAIGLLTEWQDNGTKIARTKQDDLGGSMRLGSYPAKLRAGSKAAEIYGTLEIAERHRHRYEVNKNYQSALEQTGLMISGFSVDGQLPEIIERPDHRFFMGVQFHPELKSRPFLPHPLFLSFVRAALSQMRLV